VGNENSVRHCSQHTWIEDTNFVSRCRWVGFTEINWKALECEFAIDSAGSEQSSDMVNTAKSFRFHKR
jgi:hypothetical protein